jgi:hypothetical protein
MFGLPQRLARCKRAAQNHRAEWLVQRLTGRDGDFATHSLRTAFATSGIERGAAFRRSAGASAGLVNTIIDEAARILATMENELGVP